MKYPEIRVHLIPDDPNPSDAYVAIIMDYDVEQLTWYNTGIVCRASSPKEAFEQALLKYETN